MSAPADTLTPYVPRFVRRQLAVRRGAPTAPFADSLPGAALFVDISGSTALAERLAARGSTGAEELSALFNAHFGRLIELIAAHGGDVMQFAGDGLLALWTAEGTDIGLDVLTPRVYQLAQPNVWLWQGLCDWLLARKPAKAHKAWRKSFAAAQRLDMAYEEGLALYQIGRHLAADDPARQEHLQPAAEIFRKLDAVRDRARAETALAAEPPDPRD